MEPCKDCDRREVGCHIDCEDYISWCKEREEKRKVKTEYLKEHDPYSHFSTRKRNFYRKRGWLK